MGKLALPGGVGFSSFGFVGLDLLLLFLENMCYFVLHVTSIILILSNMYTLYAIMCHVQ